VGGGGAGVDVGAGGRGVAVLVGGPTVGEGGCVGVGDSGGAVGSGGEVGSGVSDGLATAVGVAVNVGTKVLVGVGVSAGAWNNPPREHPRSIAANRGRVNSAASFLLITLLSLSYCLHYSRFRVECKSVAGARASLAYAQPVRRRHAISHDVPLTSRGPHGLLSDRGVRVVHARRKPASRQWPPVVVGPGFGFPLSRPRMVHSSPVALDAEGEECGQEKKAGTGREGCVGM
jgi:hypothetical protein